MLRALKRPIPGSESVQLEFEENLKLHYMECVGLRKISLLSTSVGYSPLFYFNAHYISL